MDDSTFKAIQAFIQEVLSEWGSAVTGGLSGPLFIWALSTSGAPHVVSMALAVLCVYVASYKVWKRERERRTKAESERDRLQKELNAPSDMRGDIWIEVSNINPYADKNIVASRFRYTCECSNHGRTDREICNVRIRIEPLGQPWFEILDPIQAQVISPARLFRHNSSKVIFGVSPEELSRAQIAVYLIDSLNKRYLGTVTKRSPRILKEEL